MMMIIQEGANRLFCKICAFSVEPAFRPHQSGACNFSNRTCEHAREEALLKKSFIGKKTYEAATGTKKAVEPAKLKKVLGTLQDAQYRIVGDLIFPRNLAGRPEVE
jgi:hypothetical protein